MALKPFRDEQLNYFKFAFIVLDELPKALRQTFRTMWDNTFGHLPGYQPWDDSTAVRNLFLGAEGYKTKVPTHLSYDEWDCTAMFQATIYARSFALPDSKGHHRTLADLYVKPRGFHPAGSFHRSVISPGGNNAETFALAIDQLRLLRNSFCHSSSSEMTKITFAQYVQLAKDAFKALGVNTNPIDAVGGLTDSDFPTERVRHLEEDIRSELQADKKFLEEEVKDELQGVRSDIAHSNKEREKDQKRTETVRKDEILDLKNLLKRNKVELKEKLEDITSVITHSNQKHLEHQKETGAETKNTLESLRKQLHSDKHELKEDIRKATEKNMEATAAANRKFIENMAVLKDEIIMSKKIGAEVVLPRSCLPSIVPHFTGRQSECETIIGHVMSDSTRLVSIWGSPGFGKTSVAIAAGHHLQSQGLPVYFLSLRGRRSKADLTSKLLSFFTQPGTNGQSSQRLSLDDELCHLFTKVLDGSVFILDNADELFESGTPEGKEEVVNLLEEILRRNEKVKFILTTRESIEFMNVRFQGHQAVRIRSLEKLSSENFVHQLLPNATDSDCIRLTQICGHVPLAIKLLCSSISEDYAQPSQFLDEFIRDTEINIIQMLDNPDYPSQLRLQLLFNSSFQRLPAREKEALVSLSILPENFDREVAEAVLDQTTIFATKILQSLRRKSLLDSRFKPGSFSMHSLVQSFARAKGEREMNETVNRSKARLYAFYISLIKKLNKQYLTGQSMSAFNQFYDNQRSIVQSLKHGCMYSSTAKNLFSVLVNAELFLNSLDVNEEANPYLIYQIYDSAIEAASNLETNVFHRQLLVSKAFFEVILGAEGRTMHLLSEAKKIQDSSNLVSFGEKGKTLCYSGLCQLITGKTEEGIQILRESLVLMEGTPKQPVLKIVVCQILAIYYRFIKDSSSFNHFYSKALQECTAAGDTQLLVISAKGSTEKTTDQEKKSQKSIDNLENQPLQLTVLLLVSTAARNFSDFETKQFVSGVPLKLLQNSETAIPHRTLGLLTFQRNIVHALYWLNSTEDAFELSKARVRYYQTEVNQCNSGEECVNQFPANSNLHQGYLADSYWDLGIGQYRTKNFTEAAQSHQRALEIRLKLFGEEHPATAESYHVLGIAQHAQGDLKSALQSSQRALDIRRRLFGQEHLSIAASYASLGVTQHAQGDLTSALQSLQHALDVRLKLLGEEHSATADSYHLLGIVQQTKGDLTSALQSLQRAIDIRLKLLGEEHPITADNYFILGLIQHEQGHLMSALQSKQHALDIRLKLFGQENSSTADSYSSLGRTQLEQGNLMSALLSGQRALDIRLRLFGEEHSSTADSHQFLGQIQLAQGDLTSTLESQQRALDIRLKLFGEEHSRTADSYHSLGDTQYLLRDFKSSLQAFQCAFDIRQKLFGEEHSSTADSYSSLGDTQHALGDILSALQSKQSALNISLKLLGEEHASTFIRYYSLGNAQHALGDLASAVQSKQRALDIAQKLYGEEHSRTAGSYESLGVTQHAQGDLGSAFQSTQRALNIRLRLFGEEHSSTAESYHSLGVTQHKQGDLTLALQSHQRALNIRLKLFGKEHSSTADSYSLLGDTRHALGHLKSAFKCKQHSLDIRLKLYLKNIVKSYMN